MRTSPPRTREDVAFVIELDKYLNDVSLGEADYDGSSSGKRLARPDDTPRGTYTLWDAVSVTPALSVAK